MGLVGKVVFVVCTCVSYSPKLVNCGYAVHACGWPTPVRLFRPCSAWADVDLRCCLPGIGVDFVRYRFWLQIACHCCAQRPSVHLLQRFATHEHSNSSLPEMPRP